MLNLWMLTLMFALHTPALGYVHLVNDRTLDLNNGNQLLLWCTDRNLSALPNLKSLAWSKDNVHIPNHDPRLNTDASKSILLIEQLRENDEGVYNCTVEAEAFLSINITRLRVLGKGPPTITSIGSRLQTNNAAPTSTQKPLKDMKVNRILELQQKVTDLLRGNSTESISTFITELVNLTKPENEIKLKAFELSSSLNMLVQFVQYNSILNNTAINSSTDQQNVIQVASNLLEEENTKTWLRLQKVNDSVTDDFLKTMDEFGSQVSSQLGGQDNSTSLVVLTRNVGFRADRFTSRQMLNVDFSHHGATIFVPGEVVSANPSATRASTIVYKTLNNILSLPMESKHEKENEQKRFKSSSSIVSATIVPRPSSPLRKPVKFVFNNTNKRSNVDRDCVFWEVRRPERVWQTQGCVRVDQESDAGVTTCECNHFTIFAVLMNNKPVDARHKSYLQYISTIGCACSLLFLLLTFIVIALCWKRLKSPRVTFLLHLCIAIAASCILLILPGYVHWEEVGCVVNAALLHYFLLCVFTWMMCHGGMLYYLIIKVELRDKLKPKMKWFYAFGWGLPVLIVAVSLAVTGTKKYAASNCWLTLERGLIYWAFVGPVAVVIFVNSILFVFLLWRINRVSKFRESMTRAQHVKAWLRRSIVLLPVLGVTWSFGLLTFISSTVVFHYLFTIFNSLQGFVIFFNFCIIDYEVRAVMISTLCRRHYTASLNEAKETANRHGERRVSVQTLPAVPAKTQWKEEQGFHNMAQNTADSEIQLPKIQTWMTSIHL